jgi:thioredoxin 2
MDDTVLAQCRSCGARNKVLAEKIASGPRCGRCGEKLSIPTGAIEVSEQNFRQEVLEETIPMAVDFWAPWCGPCRMMAPVLEGVARDNPGRVKVVKVNADQNQALASRYGIQGIPTLILFRNGKETDRLVGAARREQIIRFLGL